MKKWGDMSSSQSIKKHKHHNSKNFLPEGAANKIPLEAHDHPWQRGTYPREGRELQSPSLA